MSVDDVDDIIGWIQSGGRVPQTPSQDAVQAAPGGGSGTGTSSAPKLSSMVDQTVTFTGVAHNAFQGAMVLRGHAPVYVEGLSQWPAEFLQKQVEVSGVLRKKKLSPDPTVDADGAVSHGAVGEDYVLESARYQLV